DYLEMAQEKFSSEQKRLEEIEAELPQAKAQFLRQQKLADEKISSELKFQEAEFKYKALLAKVSKTQFDVAAANQEIEAKTRDREAKKEKAQADIEYATAMLRDATGKVAKAEADVAKSANEVAKAEKELSEMQSELARQHSQRVTAPMDGIVIDIVPNQGSQLVKSGETLCWIVPDTAARAVQLWVDGNDAALVEQGRRVRLQFEGWPAVQFSGWPSVAVGTFGGVVSSVDAFDDGQGNFRMVVIPDDTDEAWPDTRYLRQGVRANGWVLLDQVPLWYEVWRRMNGFPASTSQTPLKTQKGEASKKSKSPGEKTKSY
ncbi:MAG: HlyD family efflux transporter periplasmic adaptor subunit, partial [Planctomycetales bacterium]